MLRGMDFFSFSVGSFVGIAFSFGAMALVNHWGRH